jgi:ArsR family transcriptional regulator
MNISPLQVFKCLSDDTRLKVCLLIRDHGELCVCELVEALDETQPKISRHLANLRSCQLLQDRKAGQWVFYSLHPELKQWVNDTLQQVTQEHVEYLFACSQRLHAMQDRPEREKCC